MQHTNVKLSGEIWKVESTRYILRFPRSCAESQEKAIEVALATNRVFDWEVLHVTKESMNGSS